MSKTYETSAPRCPYCQHMQEHDGDFFYDESRTEAECDACARAFNMRVYTSTSWTCTPQGPDQ